MKREASFTLCLVWTLIARLVRSLLVADTLLDRSLAARLFYGCKLETISFPLADDVSENSETSYAQHLYIGKNVSYAL